MVWIENLMLLFQNCWLLSNKYKKLDISTKNYALYTPTNSVLLQIMFIDLHLIAELFEFSCLRLFLKRNIFEKFMTFLFILQERERYKSKQRAFTLLQNHIFTISRIWVVHVKTTSTTFSVYLCTLLLFSSVITSCWSQRRPT